MQSDDVLTGKACRYRHFIQLSWGDKFGVIMGAAIKQAQHILCPNYGKQVRFRIAVNRR